MQPWITRPLRPLDFGMSIPTPFNSSDVWLSMSVRLKMSLTSPHPPARPPTRPSDTLAHTDTHRAIPVCHLSPCPQQTAEGRPSIATVRWDGPLGFEFQMAEQRSWYGHRGSCWGTVLPLLWPGATGPAPKPPFATRNSQFRSTEPLEVMTGWLESSVTKNRYFQSCCWLPIPYLPPHSIHLSLLHLQDWFIG